MVTFSNFRSVSHHEASTAAEAVTQVSEMDPDLEIDGEMQADTALDFIKLKSTYRFPDSRARRTYLFSHGCHATLPTSYWKKLGGADVIGPVLLGMAKPVHVLQRGSSLTNVLDLATVASVDWPGPETDKFRACPARLGGGASFLLPETKAMPGLSRLWFNAGADGALNYQKRN